MLKFTSQNTTMTWVTLWDDNIVFIVLYIKWLTVNSNFR